MTTVNKEPGERILTLGPKGKTMELEVPLTPEHLHALEKQIADVSAEAFQTEEAKKATVKPFTDKLSELKTRERELLARRHKGVMLTKVPVETRANTFKREKWLVRLDTGEEVPDTRRALTDEDLQALLPGVVLEGDNRPDAPVLSLFAHQQETKEQPAATPWSQSLPAPYEDWHVSEIAGNDGERLYMVARGPVENPSRAWGPFGYTWSEGFHPPGDPTGTIGDDVRASMAEALGLTAMEDDGERIPADESPAFEKFLSAVESLASERISALKSESLPPAPEGGLKLYHAAGHPGWGGYVYEGQLFLRPPNVDSFEPPRSPKDKGPLEWDPEEKRFDGVKGANVTSEWLTEQDKLLAEFDFLKKTGKISEPVNELKLPPPPDADSEADTLEDDGVEVEQELDEAKAEDVAGEPPLSPAEAAASTAGDGGHDVAALADKLTDNGRKLLKALVTSGPNTSARLGSMTGCGKPGSALKHLARDAMVSVRPPGPGEAAEIWDVTDLGRLVYEAAIK